MGVQELPLYAFVFEVAADEPIVLEIILRSQPVACRIACVVVLV